MARECRAEGCYMEVLGNSQYCCDGCKKYPVLCDRCGEPKSRRAKMCKLCREGKANAKR